MSTPTIQQPVTATANNAGPPEPLATPSNSVEESSSSHSQKVRCSFAVSHEFWPMSSPDASRLIAAYSSSANRR
jgi:hypothetical protein